MTLPMIELYRPKDFSEVIGVPDLDRFEEMIKTPMDMPNLLFVGPQGVGKTTVAKIIIEKLKPLDVIRINGSDTTGIDTIREKVYNFMTAMSSVPGKPKLIWIEEFDFMSPNAFAALRSMIEQYIKNARFICTANYLAKIPEPVRSRFSVVEFKKPNDEDIFVRMRSICDSDGISAKDFVLKEIITANNGDVRATINMIQQCSSNLSRTLDARYLLKSAILAKEVCGLIKRNNWKSLRYDIPEKRPDYNRLFVELELMFDDRNVTEIISSGLVEMSLSFNKDIAFAAICSRIIKIL